MSGLNRAEAVGGGVAIRAVSADVAEMVRGAQGVADVPRAILAAPLAVLDGWLSIAADADAARRQRVTASHLLSQATGRRKELEVEAVTFVRGLPFATVAALDDWRSALADLAAARAPRPMNVAPGDFAAYVERAGRLAVDLRENQDLISRCAAKAEAVGGGDALEVHRVVARWLDDLAPGATIRPVEVKPVETLAAAQAAVDRVRQEIARIEAAPAPLDEALVEMRARLDANSRGPQVAPDGRVDFPHVTASTANLLALVVWAARPQFESELTRELEAVDRTGAIARGERPAALAQARQALHAAALVEEATIRAQRAKGARAPRRAGLPPATYLMAEAA